MVPASEASQTPGLYNNLAGHCLMDLEEWFELLRLQVSAVACFELTFYFGNEELQKQEKSVYLKELGEFCSQHFVQIIYQYLIYHPPYTFWRY